MIWDEAPVRTSAADTAGDARRPSARKKSETRSGNITDRLRQAILDGEFGRRGRINEVHLGRALSVSRTPIRAALQTLAGEGLLRYEPNRGFTIRPFSISEIVDAYEMRALAEGLAARLAAERGLSDAARATIEKALAAADAALLKSDDLDSSREIYTDANSVFHATVYDAAGSQLVMEVLRLCQRVPQASAHYIVAFGSEDVRKRHQAHHDIYAAILGREPIEAERLMRSHMAHVKVAMVREFSRQEMATQSCSNRPHDTSLVP